MSFRCFTGVLLIVLSAYSLLAACMGFELWLQLDAFPAHEYYKTKYLIVWVTHLWLFITSAAGLLAVTWGKVSSCCNAIFSVRKTDLSVSLKNLTKYEQFTDEPETV
jgi:hypothetical protein